jgi:hypothetical protein
VHRRDIIDCEAFGNPSHPASSRPSEVSDDNGVQGRGRCRVVVQEPHLPKVLAPCGSPEQDARQLVERADGRSGHRAGGAEKGESPLPLL